MSSRSPRKQPGGEVITTITATTQVELPLHPRKPTYAELNPKSIPDEFFGPVGTAVISVVVFVFSYGMYFACNERTGCAAPWYWELSDYERYAHHVEYFAGKVFDGKALLVYLAWYAYCVVMWAIVPGKWVEGTLIRNGTKKLYKINALPLLLTSVGLTAGLLLPGHSSKGAEALSWMYDHFVGLLSAALAMSVVQATWCYVWSFYSREILAKGGNSGVAVYDWWMGRPLNPTIPGFPNFDLKSFNELRPGLVLWVVLNLACLCEQSLRLGGISKVTNSMWAVNIMQGVYVFDAVFVEPSVLTTMDITTDGFGFMLAFGDLVWVPFTYTLQARYLAFHPVQLPTAGFLAILALEFVGYYIFRTANKEKDDFKSGRNPKNLEFMTTEKGGKLITSGWWGRSRHPNYFGDWCMALAWCLPTGFDTPLTYFYIGYFLVLLLHRQIRDDHQCRLKHGKSWDEYCKKVPYKIIPGVY